MLQTATVGSQPLGTILADIASNCGVGMGRFCLPVLKSEFIQLVAKRAQADAKAFGRSRPISASVLQRSTDQLFLHFAHGDTG